MTRPSPVASLVVPVPSRPTIPTIVGSVLFGSIFIVLIAGCLYYANMCRGDTNRSSPNQGHRGDFFHRLRDLRSTFMHEPTASILPLNVRTDNILRSLNFSHPSTHLHSPNARAQLAVPPPYGHPYTHPPSYEASISDQDTSYSPISPSTPGSAAGERTTTGRGF